MVHNKLLRQLIRKIILESMTTTPSASWATATPIGKTDEDPWNTDEDRGPCEPAKNLGGHTHGNEDHTALGDEEVVDPFNGNEPEEWQATNYWEKGYYSNPMMQRDR